MRLASDFLLGFQVPSNEGTESLNCSELSFDNASVGMDLPKGMSNGSKASPGQYTPDTLSLTHTMSPTISASSRRPEILLIWAHWKQRRIIYVKSSSLTSMVLQGRWIPWKQFPFCSLRVYPIAPLINSNPSPWVDEHTQLALPQMRIWKTQNKKKVIRKWMKNKRATRNFNKVLSCLRELR